MAAARIKVRENGDLSVLDLECPTESKIDQLCESISVLVSKFDDLTTLMKTAFRWLLGAVILIALGNSKLAEDLLAFIK